MNLPGRPGCGVARPCRFEDTRVLDAERQIVWSHVALRLADAVDLGFD